MDNYSSHQIDDMDEQWRLEDEWERNDEKNNFGEPYTEKERQSDIIKHKETKND